MQHTMIHNKVNNAKALRHIRHLKKEKCMNRTLYSHLKYKDSQNRGPRMQYIVLLIQTINNPYLILSFPKALLLLLSKYSIFAGLTNKNNNSFLLNRIPRESAQKEIRELRTPERRVTHEVSRIER